MQEDDSALLHRYAAEGSQEAFAELVARHLGLVYHAALRQCRGDRHRAEEVAQLIFTDLARKADALSRRPLLVAWLHTSVRYAAAHLRRTELRRQAREQEVFAMDGSEFAPEATADWERLRPLVDEALQSLGERDRAAVLLRFFENRSYAELAASLSVSEDAARVRVNRALEKLRSALARRGLVSTASALAVALAQPAVAAVPPAGLAAQISAGAVSAAGFAGVSAATVGATFFATAKIATGVAASITLLSLGVALHQRDSAPSPSTAIPSLSPLSAFDLAAILHPARLAAADADAALAAYLALPPLAEDAPQPEFLERAALLRTLLTILPAEHVAQLLAATSARLGDPETRLRRIAFTAWTELDAPSAARWAAALEPGPSVDDNQRTAFATEAALAWTRSDFDAAYAWASALSDAKLAPAVPLELLVRLAATDHEQALAFARAGGDAFFDAARLGIYKVWAKNDPVAALRSLGPALFENDHQRWNLLPALQTWAGRDSAAALDWVIRQRPPAPGAGNPLLDSLVHWAPEGFAAPGAFADLLASRADLTNTSKVLSAYLREWARRDASATLAWLDRLPDPARRLGLIKEALPWHGWAASDPDAYLPLALRLPAGDERDAQLANLLGSWANEDPAATSAWLANHDGPEFAAVHSRVQGAILAHLAATDPAAALARWEKLAPGDTKTAALAGIADSLAAVDPVAAAQWFGQNLPRLNEKEQSGIVGAGYTRTLGLLSGETPAHLRSTSDTLVRLVDAWYEKDPAATVAWAAALPDYGWQVNALFAANGTWNNIRDRAAHADHLARLRPDTARDWVLREHLKNWFRADESATRAWLDTHTDIPAEITAQVLSTK